MTSLPRDIRQLSEKMELRLVRYQGPEDRNFYRVISDISVVLRKTTLTILDSIQTDSPVESEIVRVVSLSTTEITEITRLKKQNKKTDPQGKIP